MDNVEALLLGSAQDGGVPQAGCHCATCTPARANPAQRRLVASLAVIDHQAGASWIVDATPDFPRQLDLLTAHAPQAPLAGIVLTHAHIGHYTGLIHTWARGDGCYRHAHLCHHGDGVLSVQ